MPIYEYECEECGEEIEILCSVTEKQDSIRCTSCSGLAKSIISAGANRMAEWSPYWDENLGDVPILVEGRAHRQKIMKENGLVDQYDVKGHNGMFELKEK